MAACVSLLLTPRSETSRRRADQEVIDTRGCARFYQVAVPRETLLEYFTSELTKRGWRIEASSAGTLITARRDTCSYVVYVETPRPGTKATTNVAAHVSCDSAHSVTADPPLVGLQELAEAGPPTRAPRR